MPLKLMYLFDPGVELSCLCNFLSLHCRMDTIENILRTAIKKKISSKGQKTWLPSRCCHACLGLSSACGPGPCKAEGWRGDADISRQAWLLRRSSRSTAACSGGLPPYLGAVWGTWGGRGVCPTPRLPGEGSQLGHMGCECCRSRRARGEGREARPASLQDPFCNSCAVLHWSEIELVCDVGQWER